MEYSKDKNNLGRKVKKLKYIDEIENIKSIVHSIANRIKPIKIYLFGSFAEGKNTQDSDYDFYVIMPDEEKRNMLDVASEAYDSVWDNYTRPMDILVNKNMYFNNRKESFNNLEYQVISKGVLMYER